MINDARVWKAFATITRARMESNPDARGRLIGALILAQVRLAYPRHDSETILKIVRERLLERGEL